MDHFFNSVKCADNLDAHLAGEVAEQVSSLTELGGETQVENLADEIFKHTEWGKSLRQDAMEKYPGYTVL